MNGFKDFMSKLTLPFRTIENAPQNYKFNMLIPSKMVNQELLSSCLHHYLPTLARTVQTSAMLSYESSFGCICDQQWGSCTAPIYQDRAASKKQLRILTGGERTCALKAKGSLELGSLLEEEHYRCLPLRI